MNRPLTNQQKEWLDAQLSAWDTWFKKHGSSTIPDYDKEFRYMNNVERIISFQRYDSHHKSFDVVSINKLIDWYKQHGKKTHNNKTQ